MAALIETSSPSLSKVSRVTIEKAVTSLLKWKSTQSETLKPQLLDSDEFVYLVLTLHKIPPKSRTNAYKIPLPNPLFSENHELCLIIDDKALDSKSAKQKVLEEKIPVAKVLKLSKLRSDYKPFEAKRKLCDSYDLFFADKRIVPLLPRAIGKHFYKKKKVPVPIELGNRNWKEQIERVCGSALFFVSTGSCAVLKVARGSMSEDEIVENVVRCIDGVVEIIPKGWKDVRSLHLKFSESVALPLYQCVPEMKLKFGGGFGGMDVVEEDKSGKVEEGEKKVEEKVGKKKKKKRGRIHEVKYLDDVGFGQDESGSDDEDDGEVIENEEEKDVELGSKKRKNVSGEEEGKKGEKGLKKKKEKGSEEEKKSKKRLSKSDNNDDDEVLGHGEEESDELGSGEKSSKKRKSVSGEKEGKKGEKGLKKKKEKVSEEKKKEKGAEEKKSKKRLSKNDNDEGDEEGEDVSNVSKGKKMDKGLKKMKEEVLGKSAVVKKTKKSKVAV